MRFSPLQLMVLSTLEEAGEDDVAALLNRSNPLRGNVEEVQHLSVALIELVALGLVVAGRTRDQFTRRWSALQAEESAELFGQIAASVQWDQNAGYWRWFGEARLRALLTQAGQSTAERILAGKDLH